MPQARHTSKRSFVFVRIPIKLIDDSALVYPANAILAPFHGRFPGDVDRMDETGTMKSGEATSDGGRGVTCGSKGGL
jgi:hypothetical protein